jgi:hypothetical protein
MTYYITNTWRHVSSRSTANIDAAFAKHLREMARPSQIAFARIMRATSGHPVGVELRHHSRDAWAFALPNVSGKESWRVQYFDQDSFSGHGCYKTLTEAVESMMDDGYRTEDAGALDRMSATPRWARGLQALDVVQRLSSRKIDFEQAALELA